MPLVRSARYCDIEAGSGQMFAEPDFDDRDWPEIPVLGDLHRALIAAGRLADPDRGNGHLECRWVEEREWWYRFALPDTPRPLDEERITLTFAGLATRASIWLDGEPLGDHLNMFRPACYDITEAMHRRTSDRPPVVAVRFSPLLEPGQTVAEIRTAQYSLGWDFAPRRPPVGLWRPVSVEVHRCASIEAVGFTTVALRPGEASVRVTVDVDAFAAAEGVALQVDLVDPDGRNAARTQVAATAGTNHIDLTVAQPRLWWTHDRGRPDLYELAVQLTAGAVLADSWVGPVGIRTVALDTSPPSDTDREGAESFRFVLNGELLPARGANWVPCDVAIGTDQGGRIDRLLSTAAQANMNMIRIWGGGIYEDETFYETCDRLGLLVWQDFMYACFPYRDDPALLVEADAEARYQVRRLRTHPSLALWCGNNEVEVLANLRRGADRSPGHELFYRVLAEVVATESPGTPYTATSPEPTNAEHRGDRHNWEVWHGLGSVATSPVALLPGGPVVDPASPEAKEFVDRAGAHRYLDDLGRFTSEYGLGSAAGYETLAAWLDPDQLYLGSDQIRSRLRPDLLGPGNKFDLLVGAAVGPPSDLREFVAFSQLAQAEGVKVGAEHYRRRWPHCGGSLVWQLNDCWPAISWAMIDHDLRPKAVWYYARRFFAPVLASFAPTADGVELWLNNDSTDPIDDELTVELKTFSGDAVLSDTFAVSAPAGSCARVGSWAMDRGRDRVLTAHSARGLVPANRHLFAPIAALDRRPPVVDCESGLVDGLLTVRLTADAYAFGVHVAVDDPAATFTDNWFDLAPGETRTVTAAVDRLPAVEVGSR